MNNEIVFKIKTALSETLNLGSTENIISSTKLREDLGLDSMSSLTFLMALEDSINGFKVDPNTLQMEDLATLSSITNYVAEAIHV